MKTKKIKNASSGISPTLQKTFVIASIVAFLFITLVNISSFSSIPSVSISLDNFPVYWIDIIVVPFILYLLGLMLFKTAENKTSQHFLSCLIAILGVSVSSVCAAVFMELFRQQLGYGDTPGEWTSQWFQLIPTIFAFTITIFIALFIFKLEQKTDASVTKTIQKTAIITVGVSILVSSIASFINMSSNNFSGGSTDANGAVSFLIATLSAILIPSIIIYLVSSRKQTNLLRVFITMLYMLIGMAVFVVVGTSALLLDMYVGQMAIFSNGVFLFAVPLIIFVLIVAIQKSRKIF